MCVCICCLQDGRQRNATSEESRGPNGGEENGDRTSQKDSEQLCDLLNSSKLFIPSNTPRCRYRDVSVSKKTHTHTYDGLLEKYKDFVFNEYKNEVAHFFKGVRFEIYSSGRYTAVSVLLPFFKSSLKLFGNRGFEFYAAFPSISFTSRHR